MDPQRLCQLEQVHKVRLTDNSQVTKAASLAAKEAALLMSYDIPPAMKQALVKLLSREVYKWAKTFLRPLGFEGLGGSGGGGGGGVDDDEEGEEFTQGPLQTLLTQLVQKKRPSQTPAEAAAASPTPIARKRLRFLPSTLQRMKKKANPLYWDELPFAGDPLSGETMADKLEATSRSIKRKACKVRGRCSTEVDKLKRPPG